MRSLRSNIRSLRLLLLLLLAPLPGGCSLVRLHDNAQEFYASTVLAGRVTPPPGWSGPVIVAATTQARGQTVIAHQVLLHETGGYELIVPDGRYRLHAFGDRDGNGRPDAADPAGTLAEPVDVHGAGIVSMLDLSLDYAAAPDVRAALPASSPPTHSTQAGAIADPDTPAFSAASGQRGYWAPLDSFREIGGNVYFLEPYDPQRIPVLFVHGAMGSAQDWRFFFERLDRTRYQAWFFQYPSGAPCDSMANLLYWKLLNLQLRYGFEQLHLVAHSMGGLVVRRFLLDHGEQFPQIGLFVSLSTPWGGESTAALGVEHSPAVVPSWRDMQPGGAFMQRLFERPLPASIDYALLFSHRGGYNLLRPNTDGAVTLASQLRPAAQKEARLVMGYDVSHTDILADAEAFAEIERLMGDAGTGKDTAGGGRLQVTLNHPAIDTAALPILSLTRVDDTAAIRPRQLLTLQTGDESPAVVGPIAPGEYDAQIGLSAFRGAPLRQRIRIEKGASLPLRFQLAPDGQLVGSIGAQGDSTMHPAGSLRQTHASLRIQKVVLDGPGGQRVLTPTPDADLFAAFMDGRDAATGAMFSFVGLAAGDYALTVHADGYEPQTSHHRVEPGRAAPLAPIILRSKKS